MNNKSFITTCDEETANKLRSLNFQEILNQNADIFVFINNDKISFAKDIDVSKIKYSNTLFY